MRMESLRIQQKYSVKLGMSRKAQVQFNYGGSSTAAPRPYLGCAWGQPSPVSASKLPSEARRGRQSTSVMSMSSLLLLVVWLLFARRA
ncbi:hypothetical protein EJB05_45879 [Eragrostis curvula]|uniref:Uncharacterized protein n=1 Tax=Eragrostis curvula TaxID=38414 RepID=A0A5J9TLC1_9POAL|nr:hypothetical protein EJB05_45879 [Eragrostis curvula]